MCARRLIVNADDFGLSEGVNRGIIEAHERGIVTSASLMVRGTAAAAAAAYARAHPRLSLGLHLDLGEWSFSDGEWRPAYEVVPVQDERSVCAEVARQLARFRELVGGEPTHVDSHQHFHRSEPVRGVLLGLARELDVPLRHFTCGMGYCGQFYGQSDTGETFPVLISVEHLIGLLRSLPASVTELCCHPGYGEDLDTMYRRERALEVETLCDPRVRAAVETERIELCSFRRFAVATAGLA